MKGNRDGVVYDLSAAEAAIVGVGPATTVPVFISLMQAKLALKYFGHLVEVQELMASLPADSDWSIAWLNSDRVFRSSTMMQAVAAQLGLTDEEVDQMFIYAATLTNV
jgi:hypothetical protein